MKYTVTIETNMLGSASKITVDNLEFDTAIGALYEVWRYYNIKHSRIRGIFIKEVVESCPQDTE